MKAGPPKVTFHGQRHEVFTLILAGHSSVGNAGDMYGHLFEAKKLRAAEVRAALLPPRVAERQLKPSFEKSNRQGVLA